MSPRKTELRPYARELRREMTEQEKHLWYDYLRIAPYRFHRQKIISGFIVDFYCHAALLVVEVDGSQHYTEQGKAYDEERSNCFRQNGIEVIRFTNKEVDTQFAGVCELIAHTVETRIREIHPQDRPKRSRRRRREV